MPLRTIAQCDCPGCNTPPVYGITRGGLEWDLVVTPLPDQRWDVTLDIVRCPRCVSAGRWPVATVTTADPLA